MVGSWSVCANLLGRHNRLHPPDATVFQHHLDAVRVRRALCKDSSDYALRPRTGRLVLLFNYEHPLTGTDLASIGYRHNGSVTPYRLTQFRRASQKLVHNAPYGLAGPALEAQCDHRLRDRRPRERPAVGELDFHTIAQ